MVGYWAAGTGLLILGCWYWVAGTGLLVLGERCGLELDTRAVPASTTRGHVEKFHFVIAWWLSAVQFVYVEGCWFGRWYSEFSDILILSGTT